MLRWTMTRQIARIYGHSQYLCRPCQLVDLFYLCVKQIISTLPPSPVPGTELEWVAAVVGAPLALWERKLHRGIAREEAVCVTAGAIALATRD